ncbi:MAG: hypothetical protein JO231_24455 [Acidobacteria bacterium]|nr:hypothetical protein [Acidobacteriota bacterium]
MSKEFEAAMTCNECGKSSSLDLGASGASDPRCPICGAFQMKTPQVIAYGESLANWLERLPVPPGELTRMRDMVTRFLWLAERRGVRFSSGDNASGQITGTTETQLRASAPTIRHVVTAMGDAKSH